MKKGCMRHKRLGTTDRQEERHLDCKKANSRNPHRFGFYTNVSGADLPAVNT